MKAMRRRVELLSAKRAEEDGPRFVRLVRILDPGLPEARQGRWLEAAEALVADELAATRRRAVLLWSHVDSPGVVTVDGPGVRYLVGIEDRDGFATPTVLERSP